MERIKKLQKFIEERGEEQAHGAVIRQGIA